MSIVSQIGHIASVGPRLHRTYQPLVLQCGWCGLMLSGPATGQTLPRQVGNVSHGICLPCRTATQAKYNATRGQV